MVANINHVFCADVTVIGPFFLFLIMDLASRAIIGHKLQQKEFIVSDIIESLTNALACRIKPANTILHTDNHAIFKSEDFNNFAKQVQLDLSRGHAARHENQAIERLIRTIKQKIAHFLFQQLEMPCPKGYISKEELNKLVIQFNASNKQIEFASIIIKVIEQYNNQPHGAVRMFKMAPSNMDEALFTQEQIDKKNLRLRSTQFAIATNDNSPQAIAIANYKAQVAERFAGNWVQFFLDFEKRTTESLQEIKEINVRLEQQNQKLYEQNLQFAQQLQYMEKREKEREIYEAELFAKRVKRKQAKRKPIRDAITPEEFIKILQIAEEAFREPLAKARIKCAITLLYYTGLRISNLLLLRRRDLTQLIELGECQLPIIKGGYPRRLIIIGVEGRKALNALFPEIQVLLYNQPNEGASIFASKYDTSKAVSTRVFREQVNSVLIKASNLLGKHIRSHSFRATFITDLLNLGVPIEKTKDIIGHNDIGTTATYSRTRITLKEARQITSAINKSRSKGAKPLICRENKLKEPEYKKRNKKIN